MTTQVRIIVSGNKDENAGLLLAIGSLVVSWSNAESVFHTIVEHLLPRSDNLSASIIWYSFKGNNKGRTDLIQRLLREQVRDPKLNKDVEKACRQFLDLSKSRNFYCHGVYSYDSGDIIDSVQGVELTRDGDPVRITDRPVNKAMFNEIAESTKALVEFSHHLWSISDRVADALGVPRSEHPLPHHASDK